jgi:hypothetical protein
MKLIWTYSSKLNRSKNIDNSQMLSLYKNSIECGKQFHSTCVYTDEESKSFFENIVDEVAILPIDFDYYFLDDIKFYVFSVESDPFTLIDGDLFLKESIPNTSTEISMETYVDYLFNNDYIRYNKILQQNGVSEIIPYWYPLNGYYKLGLVTINDTKSFKEFYSDYNKLKDFYKNKIENIFLNRFDERVEISLCTYFLTLYCHYKNIQIETYDKLIKFEHLAGPTEKEKLSYIYKHMMKTLI